MSLKYAILGFLEWKSLAGYDLKKMFRGSVSLYWSGNNNQIYGTLDKLKKEKLVTMQVHMQETSPPRKVYSITQKGRDELREWLSSPPALPLLKHSLLVQLAWSDQLTREELVSICRIYEEKVSHHLALLKGTKQREYVSTGRTPRERFLWSKILENGIRFYSGELDWIRDVISGL